MHDSIGVLGAISVVTALLLDGAAGRDLAAIKPGQTRFDIEHPTGHLEVEAEVDQASQLPRVIRSASAVSASSSATVSYPLRPNLTAGTTTTGMPLSMQVTVTSSMTSVTWPVGSSAPVTEPSVPAKSSTTGAAVPGTPAIAVSPS